jgi:hypothetical protein
VTISQNHRVICWIERAVLLLSVLYLCIHTIPRAWSTLNTDFPNYYTSARLVHEGYDASRMYEWSWIEREKDHRAIDIRVIGLIPITPFSTLVVWPLTNFAPLTAKHLWTLLNLVFLIPIVWMLRSMTGLSYQRVALSFALSFPLHKNLLYGQFYIFLLLLIVAACWTYLRGFHVLAGVLIALAAACKIFPVLFFAFFLQCRDWRALIGGVVTGLAAAAISVAVFGWNVHRTYLKEILPWALHGGGLQPYATSASISGVLHYLFLSEPQWNPHPWHFSPLCYGLLLPTLQMLAIAPAILLIHRENSRRRILLEWSALLTASLTISTLPASYNFVLMALPVCVVAAILLRRQQYWWLTALLIVYLGIGFPMPSPHRIVGLAILLYVPRLPLMFALLFGIYTLLRLGFSVRRNSPDWTRYAWAVAMSVSVVFSVLSTFHREQAVRQEYAYRLPLQYQGYLNASPKSIGTGLSYIAFTLHGYHLMTVGHREALVDSSPSSASSSDDLSFTSGLGGPLSRHVWVERALSPHSEIVEMHEPSHVVVDDAQDPMLSADGQSIAFVRDDHGCGRLMVRKDFESIAANESMLTPSSLNIYEASFISEREYAFSAVQYGNPPQIYLSDATHRNALLALGESRYPALSPDGRWMAYSRLNNGVWNLWLRDENTGVTRRIADVPCNQIQPAWESDSKTLLYSTDCGRSLWFTAVARRLVIR